MELVEWCVWVFIDTVFVHFWLFEWLSIIIIVDKTPVLHSLFTLSMFFGLIKHPFYKYMVMMTMMMNRTMMMMMTLFISESEISSASEQFRWRTCAGTINNRCFWHLFKFSLQPLVQRDEQWFYKENRRLEKVGYHKTNGVRIDRRDQMVLATDLTIPFPPGQDSFVTRIRNSSAECNNLYPVTNQSTACPFTHVSCPWDNILVALSVNKLF